MNYRSYTIFWQEVYFLIVGIFWTTVFVGTLYIKKELKISFKETIKFGKSFKKVLNYVYLEKELL